MWWKVQAIAGWVTLLYAATTDPLAGPGWGRVVPFAWFYLVTTVLVSIPFAFARGYRRGRPGQTPVAGGARETSV